jgi:hypothetical protein
MQDKSIFRPFKKRNYMGLFHRVIIIVFLAIATSRAFSADSLFEPIIRPFYLLPEYYMRFDMSTFLLQRDAFFKRQYLAEPHPDLEFYMLSYKNFIAFLWGVDFQFGFGQVPGNNVFTVLNVAMGYDPKIEVRLHDVWVTGGIAHRCFHEIDRLDFPLMYWNRMHLETSSPNARVNTFGKMLICDPGFSPKNRFAWQAGAGYYLKEMFGWVDPGKIDGNNPFIWDASLVCRYAFYKRLSWIFSMRGESTAGNFSRMGGCHVANGSNWYWHEAVGVEAFFIRGARGGCIYALYHLDDMPAQPNGPLFTLGNSRFSRNGLLQIGLTFFN